jgi:hypothetical protein
MWALTRAGIFNFVQHPTDPNMILVKARVRSHVDLFRDRYCPEMGPTYFDRERDYPYMADVTKEALAVAMGKAILDIDYEKTKPVVGALGHRVASAILKVWRDLTEIEEDPKRINFYYNRDHGKYVEDWMVERSKRGSKRGKTKS